MARAQGANPQLLCGLAWLLALGAAGCKSEDDPAVVADRFVDAYYVEFDFERAKGYAAGGASERLDQELALVSAAREKVQIGAAKARVYYETPERRPVGEDMFHATYPLEIRDGQKLITTKAIVMVAKRDGRWKVIQFREQQSGAARPDETATATTAPQGEVP